MKLIVQPDAGVSPTVTAISLASLHSFARH
jgi:hypothetical protein